MTISGKKITGCLWILRVLPNDFQQKKEFNGIPSENLRNLNGITNALFPNDPF
jgi:hypothetical protein